MDDCPQQKKMEDLQITFNTSFFFFKNVCQPKQLFERGHNFKMHFIAIFIFMAILMDMHDDYHIGEK